MLNCPHVPRGGLDLPSGARGPGGGPRRPADGRRVGPALGAPAAGDRAVGQAAGPGGGAARQVLRLLRLVHAARTRAHCRSPLTL